MIQKVKEIYKKYGVYFPADLWAMLAIVLMLLIGIIFFGND